MTDTQQLHITENLTIDSSETPSRKGHRHKRSFAISGDFEFLKQPGSVPPLPCSSPDPSTANSYTHNNQTLQTEPTEDDTLSIPETSMPLSPFRISNQMSSPRFFISEEPKFSSPFQGVPDAIINLDDALKAKPKCFKNHKRSESAPPDLAVLLNPQTITRATVMIEEEEDDESRSNSDSSSFQDQRDTIIPSLLSPLRPYSPTMKPDSQYTNLTGSPIQSRNAGNNSNSNKFNSLKISGQKQRYHHYTKKLPINANSNIQAQSLREKPSSSSLSSGVIRTPLSTSGTPSKQVSTPSTPVSFTHSGANNLFKPTGYERGPISPIRNHRSTAYNNSNGNNLSGTSNSIGYDYPSTTFKYETKVYDMPYGSAKSESISSRDDSTLLRKEVSFCDDLAAADEVLQVDPRVDVSSFEKMQDEKPLSKEILFGEPGDVVDLSTLPSSMKDSNENSDTIRSSSMTQPASVNEQLSQTHVDSPESRSVSDSVLIIEEKTRKDKKKVKSKLNFLFGNFFNKTSNEVASHDKKI